MDFEMINIDDSKIGVSKFINIGLTCYMNSILHILQQISEFVNYLYKINFDNKDTVIYELFKLLDYSLKNDDIIITPINFKNKIGLDNQIWNQHLQQDSAEFLTYLISKLENELMVKSEFILNKNFLNKKVENNLTISVLDNIKNIIHLNNWKKTLLLENTPLKNMFYGINEYSRQCNYCKNVYYASDIFNILTLPISEHVDDNKSYSLYECLDYNFKEKINYSYIVCNFCGKKNNNFYEKQVFFKTPQILIIQLKRFELNHKFYCNIDYPINLDLSKYFNQTSPYFNNFNYHLIGVNLHLGKNMSSGHYTSIIKNMFNNKWYYYDDGNDIIEYNEKQIIDNNAYLLFYKNLII
jgi:ubiquitin C-terminal hydrolase